MRATAGRRRHRARNGDERRGGETPPARGAARRATAVQRRLLLAWGCGLLVGPPWALSCSRSQRDAAGERDVPPLVPASPAQMREALARARAEQSERVHFNLPQPILEPLPEPLPQLQWPAELRPVTGIELHRALRASSAKGVLVNVWATFCHPCKEEMPMLLELRRRYAERGLDVWFVSVDRHEQAQAALEFLKQQDAPLPGYVAVGPLGYFKQAMCPLWEGSLPATFLFDEHGRLRYMWAAQAFESELVPILDGFLSGEKIDGMANFRIRRGPGR